MSNLTRLLDAAEQGDTRAAEQLLPLVYDELRRLAARKIGREAPGQTLDATALVHEAYLRLVGGAAPNSYQGRSHFFAAAAAAMRRILIDRARPKRAEMCGGGRQPGRPPAARAPPAPTEDLRALEGALHKRAALAPVRARWVELRSFAGLPGEQAADVLGISPSTADRHWSYARAWLQAEVRGE